MSGISPSLPLRRDTRYPGYALNSNMLDVIKQNFKHLVLTAPGERMMIPDFGVGIRNFLFEQNNESTYSAVRSKISQQTGKYMPFVSIQDIQFEPGDNVENQAQIIIVYEVLPLQLSDTLAIEV
jgi:phage baseplate assembly protein W